MKQKNLFQAYKEIPQEQIAKVILDFQNIDYVNSSGISVIVQLIKSAELRQGSFAFSHLNSHLHRVFDLVGLIDIIPSYATVKEAVGQL